MYQVVLVEDDLLLGEVISKGLKASGMDCTHLSSHDSASKFFSTALKTRQSSGGNSAKRNSRARVDAAVIDYYLDRGNTGLSLCKKIRRISNLPIIMLSAETSSDTVVTCLNEGADQYVTKPFVLEELVARVRASIRSRHLTHLSRAGSDDGAAPTLSVNERELRFDGNEIQLTEKETLLADALLINQGEPVEKTWILHHVHGESGDVYSRSLDMMVVRLRRKMAILSPRLKILSVRHVGYKLIVKSHER
ncbi:MAG: response regulator transcription factor [Pseudohongiellaceae bacterium]